MIDSLIYRPQGLIEQLTNLHRALSRSLEVDGPPHAIRSVAVGSFPPLNVARTPDSVQVYAFAPGLEAASIEVTVERGVLKISGERKAITHEGDRAVQKYASERSLGRFSRVLELPDDVDNTKVEARYRNGVLRVSLGIQEASRPQRIAVQ